MSKRINVSDPKQKRFEGFVQVFYPEKFYGFLSQSLPGAECHAPGIHFGARNIVPDWKGSTSYAWAEGTPVSFVLIKRPSKKFNGAMWTSADDVCPLFAEEPTESLETYAETSRVRSWNGRFGEFQRECGDVLFFHRKSVADRFKHLLINLNVGDWVYHRVGKRDDKRWHAIDVELFSEAEQARLQQGLLAQEPEPAVEPVPEILATQNRNKSIVRLIADRRRHG
jgi:hypothetical protein